MTTTNETAALREREHAALAVVERELPSAIALRHALHRDPTLGGEEDRNRPLIEAALGCSLVEVAEGGFCRVGDSTGPAVAIRAELDALPITEQSGVVFQSTRPGVAHLCGHDVHTAALVAASRAIGFVGAPSPLVAVFQPREETTPSGALSLLGDNAFQSQDIRAMIGVHLQPRIPTGSVSAQPGPINASADTFTIVVHGRPAHGAYPHLARDPVLAAAAIITALQHLVSRRVDPMNPAVVTVGRIVGGQAPNQIPERVTLEGTIRSFTEDDRRHLSQALRETVSGTARAHGCEAEVDVELGEPVLRNDSALAVSVSDALQLAGFHTGSAVRSCGADDFAYYVSRFPSVMIFAGVGDGAADSPGLHHPRFAPADDIIADVARIMVVAYFAAVERSAP
ncbi:hypothetical protein BVC93_27285 [Mycobacterium sp. MS1601]|uniref:M20 metallopeptidase family protein n=1 Tax=Mycobacterium sp. MS1601 TaxID=1936029 RepID=UPI0009794396|nr:M20 family metallopeptidase [Mycobacterium sp. MS1601]AQA05465.1 hypothetical protein BVC93_27285 [Mycobacterium sp. MS1601]